MWKNSVQIDTKNHNKATFTKQFPPPSRGRIPERVRSTPERDKEDANKKKALPRTSLVRLCSFANDIFGAAKKWNCFIFLMPLILSACTGQMAASQTGSDNTQAPSQGIPTPVYLQARALPPPTGDITQSRFSMRALAYLEQHSTKYGIMDVFGELAFMSETVDQLQQKHVRFQQIKSGVPVWGRQLIVHFDERGEAMNITGAFLSGLGRIDVQPHVSTDAAAATAVALKGEGWRAANKVLCIYLHEFQPLLAYHITLTRGLERWFVFVDASDGTVLHQVTGMSTAAP